MMPKFWLELLECEMVTRTAKHVLDGYLTENGVVAETQPAQTISSFLSALMSESDETAGQTENRLNRDAGPDDDDDLGTLTIAGVLSVAHGVAIASNTVRNRRELWNDIEKDAERRFQCTLPLFNTGTKSPQTLYAGLLSASVSTLWYQADSPQLRSWRKLPWWRNQCRGFRLSLFST